MAKEPTTDLSTETRFPTAEELEVVYGAIMDGSEITLQVADPDTIARDIAERIKNAETFEDAFGVQELDSWSDYEGVPFFVRSLKFNKSTQNQKAGSPSVYAVVELDRADDGETITVTTGGKNVLIQLVKMIEKGWTDKPVKLTSMPTGSGNTVHRLVPA